MQEANAEKKDGDSKDGDKKDGKDGGNTIKIKQSNDCGAAASYSCTNDVFLVGTQTD
jgi:hypothetical protein